VLVTAAQLPPGAVAAVVSMVRPHAMTQLWSSRALTPARACAERHQGLASSQPCCGQRRWPSRSPSSPLAARQVPHLDGRATAKATVSRYGLRGALRRLVAGAHDALRAALAPLAASASQAVAPAGWRKGDRPEGMVAQLRGGLAFELAQWAARLAAPAYIKLVGRRGRGGAFGWAGRGQGRTAIAWRRPTAIRLLCLRRGGGPLRVQL
jgi:hypothetical protein